MPLFATATGLGEPEVALFFLAMLVWLAVAGAAAWLGAACRRRWLALLGVLIGSTAGVIVIAIVRTAEPPTDPDEAGTVERAWFLLASWLTVLTSSGFSLAWSASLGFRRLVVRVAGRSGDATASAVVGTPREVGDPAPAGVSARPMPEAIGFWVAVAVACYALAEPRPGVVRVFDLAVGIGVTAAVLWGAIRGPWVSLLICLAACAVLPRGDGAMLACDWIRGGMILGWPVGMAAGALIRSETRGRVDSIELEPSPVRVEPGKGPGAD